MGIGTVTIAPCEAAAANASALESRTRMHKAKAAGITLTMIEMSAGKGKMYRVGKANILPMARPSWLRILALNISDLLASFESLQSLPDG